MGDIKGEIMNIKNWFGDWFNQSPESPKTEKSSTEIPLAYVDGNTFGTWSKISNSGPYTNNGTIRRSIDIMSYNLAQLPLNVYKDGQKIQALNDPNNVQLGSILNSPNEITSGFKFKLTHWSYFLLYDKVYWLINRNAYGIIKELYTLNPSMLKVHTDSNGVVKYYTYGKLKFSTDEVIEFSGFNPTNSTGSGGSSILNTIKTELDTEQAASKYGQKFFENGTRVGGVITGNEDTTMDEMQKVLGQWMQAHQGSANAYKVGALLGGMKYSENAMTMRDAEFIDGRKEIKDRIIEVYGIPKSVYGLVDKIDRATAEAQNRQFWQVTLKPLAILLQEDINTLMLKKNYPGLEVQFDFSVVEELKKDVNETVKAARQYFELGYTRNEVNDRFRLGMEENDDGDTRYVPTTLISIDEALEMEQLDDEKDIKLDLLLKEYSTEVVVEKEAKAKDAYRVRFLKDQRNQEKIFHSKIKRFIFEYRRDVISLVNGTKATIDETLILNELNKLKNEQDIKLVKMTEPLYIETSRVATQGSMDLLGIEGVAVGDAALANTYSNRIKGINTTLTKKLRSEVKVSVVAGESIDQLSTRLKDVYNFSTSRSKIIARTETANIMSESSFKTYKKNGITKKEWLDAGDSKVRAEHKTNAAQGAIPIDQPFASGEMFPDSVNCRCSISPSFKKES